MIHSHRFSADLLICEIGPKLKSLIAFMTDRLVLKSFSGRGRPVHCEGVSTVSYLCPVDSQWLAPSTLSPLQAVVTNRHLRCHVTAESELLPVNNLYWTEMAGFLTFPGGVFPQGLVL